MSGHKKIWLLSGVFLGAALSACGGRAAPQEPLRVGMPQDGQAVKLRVGGRLEVTLEGNPTTGYAWEQVEGDAAVLKPQGEAGFTPGSRAMGAGGTFTFLYEAAAPGKTRLALAYRRPFDKNTPPDKTFTLSVEVTP